MTDPSPESEPAATPARTAACPVCGGHSFLWGTARGKYRLRFLGDGAGWLRRAFSSGRHTRARMCRDCGNVQLFVEPGP